MWNAKDKATDNEENTPETSTTTKLYLEDMEALVELFEGKFEIEAFLKPSTNFGIFSDSSRQVFDALTQGVNFKDDGERLADQNKYVSYWKPLFNHYRRTMAGMYKLHKKNASSGLLKHKELWKTPKTSRKRSSVKDKAPKTTPKTAKTAQKSTVNSSSV
jgi:hypothetical protein